jgi:hypothetical protein
MNKLLQAFGIAAAECPKSCGTSLSAGSLDMIALAFGRAMPSLRISEKQGSSFT